MISGGLCQHRGPESLCGILPPSSRLLYKHSPDQAKLSQLLGHRGDGETGGRDTESCPILYSVGLPTTQEAFKKIYVQRKARERSHSRLWLRTSMLAPEKLGWTTRKSPFNRAGSSQGSGAKAIRAASPLCPPGPHLIFGSYHSTGEEKRS